MLYIILTTTLSMQILATGYTLLNKLGGLTTLNDYPYTDSGGTTTEEW